ncbi:hypothetical protein QNM99_19220 [Pseudomonas sp. PCH446]
MSSAFPTFIAERELLAERIVVAMSDIQVIVAAMRRGFVAPDDQKKALPEQGFCVEA